MGEITKPKVPVKMVAETDNDLKRIVLLYLEKSDSLIPEERHILLEAIRTITNPTWRIEESGAPIEMEWKKTHKG